MIFTTQPPLKTFGKVTTVERAEEVILKIIHIARITKIERLDVKITIENGIYNTFAYHRGDSLINFAKKLLDEAQKHL